MDIGSDKINKKINIPFFKVLVVFSPAIALSHMAYEKFCFCHLGYLAMLRFHDCHRSKKLLLFEGLIDKMTELSAANKTINTTGYKPKYLNLRAYLPKNKKCKAYWNEVKHQEANSRRKAKSVKKRGPPQFLQKGEPKRLPPME